MVSSKPITIDLNWAKVLTNISSTAQQIALPAKIILLADQGNNNREIGCLLNISRFMACRWGNRWLELNERAIPVKKGKTRFFK